SQMAVPQAALANSPGRSAEARVCAPRSMPRRRRGDRRGSAPSIAVRIRAAPPMAAPPRRSIRPSTQPKETDMSDFADHLAAADRFHRGLAALRVHQEFVRDALARHGYDPNQPRVPAGHREGGQWTKSGGGTPARSAARREVEVDRSGEERWGSYVSS